MILTVQLEWEYRTAPLSLPLQRAVSLFKARGRREGGKQAPPPPPLLLRPIPLFSLIFYLYPVSNIAHSFLFSLSIHLFSYFLCSLEHTYISLSPTPSYREVNRRSLLTKVTVLFQLQHCNCSSAAIYGHFRYSSQCNVMEAHPCQEK